jgi:hypothetical protein
METASLPDSRITAMAPLPGEVEMAHIVDWSSIFRTFLQRYTIYTDDEKHYSLVRSLPMIVFFYQTAVRQVTGKYRVENSSKLLNDWYYFD